MKLVMSGLLIALAGQASALSCSFANAAGGYNQAQGNGNDFVAVAGQLDWVPFGPNSDFSGFAMEKEGQEYAVAGQFIGVIIGENGVRTPIDGPVTIRSICTNGDCGYAFRGDQMISYIHNVEGERVMYAYPCQSYPQLAEASNLDAVQACVNGEACETVWDD